ncbi:unnamed protein product [Coffea canephora]|uniref:DH200=94 genomic scaffold, scaffold_572 n=1 Tax=Coffea canephora TaxID=49390 RepID=A0A068VFM7_COFCA|nr:unnamed protein product [Coffea canephora]
MHIYMYGSHEPVNCGTFDAYAFWSVVFLRQQPNPSAFSEAEFLDFTVVFSAFVIFCWMKIYESV